jgi:hypothetical protein
MARLPSTLLSLDLHNGSNSVKFSESDFRHLPKTLEEITFCLADIENIETLLCIPRSLKVLTMNVGLEERTNSLKDNPLLFDFLPTSDVQSLTIRSQTVVFAWPLWMKHIHRMKNLNTINIGIHDFIPEHSITLDFFGLLPDSITILSLPMYDTTLLPEQMAKLPPNLTSLVLRSISGTQSSLVARDDCFKHLPPSLVSLSLPFGMLGLTPKIFEVIPPSIAFLNLPSNLSEAKGAFLSSHPDWTGYRRKRSGV